MELPLVLTHNAGGSPALIVQDLATGDRRAIPSAMDGRVVTDTAIRVGNEIQCSGWRFPADFRGEVGRLNPTALKTTRSGTWHRSPSGDIKLGSGQDSRDSPLNLSQTAGASSPSTRTVWFAVTCRTVLLQ